MNDYMQAHKQNDTKQTEKQGYCFEAVFTLILGLVSILGIVLVGKGGMLGLTGLIFAFIAHTEMKNRSLKGRNFVIAGVICSVIGLVSNFYLNGNFLSLLN